MKYLHAFSDGKKFEVGIIGHLFRLKTEKQGESRETYFFNFTRVIWKVLNSHGLLSQKPIYNPYHVWYHFKELSFFYVMAHISRGYYNAGTNNIIVYTCTVCILETQQFSGKYNILPFEKCA